jgi:hypothetical protein
MGTLADVALSANGNADKESSERKNTLVSPPSSLVWLIVKLRYRKILSCSKLRVRCLLDFSANNDHFQASASRFPETSKVRRVDHRKFDP